MVDEWLYGSRGCSGSRVSVATIHRYIKSGKLKAKLVPSKFGASYIIEDLPLPTEPSVDDIQLVRALVNRIEQSSQEVGY